MNVNREEQTGWMKTKKKHSRQKNILKSVCKWIRQQKENPLNVAYNYYQKKKQVSCTCSPFSGQTRRHKVKHKEATAAPKPAAAHKHTIRCYRDLAALRNHPWGPPPPHKYFNSTTHLNSSSLASIKTKVHSLTTLTLCFFIYKHILNQCCFLLCSQNKVLTKLQHESVSALTWTHF